MHDLRQPDRRADRPRHVHGRAFLFEQACSARRAEVGERERERLLVPRRGVGAQPECDPHAAHARAVEVGGFDRDLVGRVGHFARGCAFDAGDALRLVAVGDDEEARVERPFDAVEGDHRFAVARVADDQLAPGEFVEVVEVQRLADFEHHEIRDVDGVVDRALAGEREPHAHPRLRGPYA